MLRVSTLKIRDLVLCGSYPLVPLVSQSLSLGLQPVLIPHFWCRTRLFLQLGSELGKGVQWNLLTYISVVMES
jgi:hypothetical protein